MRFDLLIKGGTVVDDPSGLSGRRDVAIVNDRIAAVEPDLPKDSAFRVIDATGLLVTPGLVDMHVHVYRGATYWGVDADAVGARSGVTSFVDAGSPGALNIEGFRKYIVEQSRTRVSSFLNISNIGLTGSDFELANLNYCDVDLFEIVASANRDILHGVKVRMGQSTLGDSGLEPLRRGREAAKRMDWPMMVHIATGPPDLGEILELMRPGDIITHCYTGQNMRLIDDAGKPLEMVRRIVDSGVILDIGHGAGSFIFKIAERALAAGMKPHAISTDIHQMSIAGPMFDLPTCLTKFLYLGMPLGETIALATEAPSRILGLEGRGSLKPGSLADVAIFSLLDGEFPLYDIGNDVRTAKQLLVNELTLVGGRILKRQDEELKRSHWVEEWGRAGADTEILAFQKELVRRNHHPEGLARHRMVPNLTPRRCC